MTILQAIFLGVIQGLTEFIPVSSTAHLLIFEHYLGLNLSGQTALVFNVLIQLGTLLALIVYYREDLWAIVSAMFNALRARHPFGNKLALLGLYLILATIPALVVWVIFKPFVEILFSSPALEASIRLLVSSLLLFLAEKLGRKSRSLDQMQWKDSIWVGLAQAIAVFPGASRSASTISGSMLRQFDRSSAARFAFLLSVPVMLAAGLFESLDLLTSQQMSGALLPAVIAGFISATIVGYLAIRWLLHYLATHSLFVFCIYCAVLGSLMLIVWGISASG